ncbi:MarR family winged helix-turn-helix transcriptional regulator [Macrococcoides caseolyticum]|uniref:MarR family winged helix-turn-helix transcriptional regulator n=1 Tax=Macrococcoides caseolyticum TaxID=69966 RepID=UPI001F28ADFB|nr:MarR family transcriptional regulator [Macrococcus caseolyticus]MCE4956260.1 MarR family transcriptional regulator [Macrococcus caseolyticus]
MDKSIITLEYELRRLADIIKDEGRSELKKHALSDTQFIAIQWVKERGPLNIGTLAKHMNLAISSTSELVDILHQNGFLERTKSMEDRRKVSILLTNKGEAVIQSVIKKRQLFLKTLISESNEFSLPIFTEQIHALYHATEEGGK